MERETGGRLRAHLGDVVDMQTGGLERIETLRNLSL